MLKIPYDTIEIRPYVRLIIYTYACKYLFDDE